MGKAIVLPTSHLARPASIDGYRPPTLPAMPRRAPELSLAGTLLQCGIGIAVGACVLGIAFNVSQNTGDQLITPLVAGGIALATSTIPSLWGASWKWAALGQRLLIAGSFAAATAVANPGRCSHVVAQDLWGLSGGGGGGGGGGGVRGVQSSAYRLGE